MVDAYDQHLLHGTVRVKLYLTAQINFFYAHFCKTTASYELSLFYTEGLQDFWMQKMGEKLEFRDIQKS